MKCPYCGVEIDEPIYWIHYGWCKSEHIKKAEAEEKKKAEAKRKRAEKKKAEAKKVELKKKAEAK